MKDEEIITAVWDEVEAETDSGPCPIPESWLAASISCDSRLTVMAKLFTRTGLPAIREYLPLVNIAMDLGFWAGVKFADRRSGSTASSRAEMDRELVEAMAENKVVERRSRWYFDALAYLYSIEPVKVHHGTR